MTPSNGPGRSPGQPAGRHDKWLVFLGLTQWQPAIYNPPHLAAIAPQITASDYHDNWTYVNGVLDLWFAMSWVPGFVTDQITRAGTAEGETPAQIAQDVSTWNNLANANLGGSIGSALPLTEFQPLNSFHRITLGSRMSITTNIGPEWTLKIIGTTSACRRS